MIETKHNGESLQTISRRQFVKTGLSGLAAAGLLLSPLGHLAEARTPAREISLYNTHTGEWGRKITYWEDGQYLTDGMAELNHILRDHRANRAATMDPALYDLLHMVNHQLKPGEAFHVISGYRCPETNSKLRKGSKGVAKFSLHMQAKAIDIRLPGVRLNQLRQASINLRRGGVGYYPKSDFVHLDTGRVRFW